MFEALQMRTHAAGEDAQVPQNNTFPMSIIDVNNGKQIKSFEYQ